MKKLTLCLYKFPYKTKYKVFLQNLLTNNLLPIIMFPQPDSAIPQKVLLLRKCFFSENATTQNVRFSKSAAFWKVPLLKKVPPLKKCRFSESADSQKVPLLKKCHFSDSDFIFVLFWLGGFPSCSREKRRRRTGKCIDLTLFQKMEAYLIFLIMAVHLICAW